MKMILNEMDMWRWGYIERVKKKGQLKQKWLQIKMCKAKMYVASMVRQSWIKRHIRICMHASASTTHWYGICSVANKASPAYTTCSIFLIPFVIAIIICNIYELQFSHRAHTIKGAVNCVDRFVTWKGTTSVRCTINDVIPFRCVIWLVVKRLCYYTVCMCSLSSVALLRLFACCKI